MIFKEILLKQLSCSVHFSFLVFFISLRISCNRQASRHCRIIISADLGPFLPEEVVVAKN